MWVFDGRTAINIKKLFYSVIPGDICRVGRMFVMNLLMNFDMMILFGHGHGTLNVE